MLVDGAVLHPRRRVTDRVVRLARLELARHRVRIDLGHPVALPQQLHAEALLELLAAGRERHAEQRPQPVLRRVAARPPQDRGERPEDDPERRAVVGDLLPVGARREAALQVRGAPGVQRRVADDVQRGDVEQRQRSGQHVIRCVPLRVRHGRRVQVEEVMRVDDALRVAGRARGELDQPGLRAVGQIAGALGGATGDPFAVLDHARAVHRRRQRALRRGDHDQFHGAEAVEFPQHGKLIAARDDRPHVRALDHALQQQPARIGVQGHGHAAGRLRAVERRQELDLVAHEEAHMTRAAKVLDQRMSHPVRLGLRLTERKSLRAVDDDPGRVGPLARLRVEHMQHGALLDREPCAVGAELGALSAQQLGHRGCTPCRHVCKLPNAWSNFHPR